jgi:RHS repeat-associated protein
VLLRSAVAFLVWVLWGQVAWANVPLLGEPSVPWTEVPVTSRDGAGRRLATSTKVGLSNVLSETLTWRGDGLLTDYTASRTDFIDTRHYGYAPWSRRLTNESLYLGDSQPLTTSYLFDQGQSGQLGVMTAASQSSSLAPGQWGVPGSGGLDGLKRVVLETNTVIRRTARGQVNGPATLRGVLNNRPLAICYDATKAGQWTADLELASGTNTLTVYADHPSGWFSTNATSVFTNVTTSDTATNQYDGGGNVIARVWRNGTTGLVRTQSLTWDAFNRVVNVTERDAQNHGYDWSAAFDGLGRRARTLITLVSNNVATATSTLIHYYDPQVEFLEVGVSVNGVAVWKLYGPDGDAPYGSQQGLGGLDVLLTAGGESIGLLQDHFGNVLGSVTNTLWSWNASPVSAYGPVDGVGMPVLASTALTPEHLSWRGKWREVTGDYYWGARPYDAKRRGFLSADPLGHGSDPALYGFCGGDAVNFWDPDGRGKNPAFEPEGGFWKSAVNVLQSIISLPGRLIGLAGYGLESSHIPLIQNVGVTVQSAGRAVQSVGPILAGAFTLDPELLTSGLRDAGLGLAAVAGVDPLFAAWVSPRGDAASHDPHLRITGGLPLPRPYAENITDAWNTWDEYSNADKEEDYSRGMKKWHTLSNTLWANHNGITAWPWNYVGGLIHEIEPFGVWAEIEGQGRYVADGPVNYFKLLLHGEWVILRVFRQDGDGWTGDPLADGLAPAHCHTEA